MNFFAQQDRAKKNTFWLLALLTAAIACLIAMVVIVLTGILFFSQRHNAPTSGAIAPPPSWWEYLSQALNSDLLFYSAGGVLLLVTCGSLYKLLQLGGRGSKVAEALGGRKIESNSHDTDERKILNVVEEMAIASGNPVPSVYLINDNSINAFAAGTDRRNAVIGVTRGCITLLSRDELQGVIAHEFSHIHFGDMRINLRLVALLHGILILGLIGSFLLRSSAFSGRGRNRSAQVGLGLAFLFLGYSGIFFGNIIKAAVSRQREFLADASAVQFTRNPDGIANALKKIGGLSSHALLSSPLAAEYSHLYFGQGIRTAFGRFMATHPPLEVRIKKVQPRWDGHFIKPEQISIAEQPVGATTVPRATISGFSPDVAMTEAVESIGNPTSASLKTAHDLIEGIPATLYDAAHDPFLARALIYSLLIDRNSVSSRQTQLDSLRQHAHPATLEAFNDLDPLVSTLPRIQHLPLIQLAVPALRSQSNAQYRVFKENLVALIKADKHVSLFEWCLYRIVTSTAEGERSRGNVNLAQAQKAVETVVAAACISGKTVDCGAAFKAAQQHLPRLTLTPEPNPDLSFQMLDKAIAQLAQLKPLHKPVFLKALAASIQADGVVTADEAELFRALADCLDCPVPLLAASGTRKNAQGA